MRLTDPAGPCSAAAAASPEGAGRAAGPASSQEGMQKGG